MTKKRWITAALVAIAACAVAACAVFVPSKPTDDLGAGTGATAPASTVADLQGSWKLVWWSDSASLPDAEITMQIDGALVSGKSACNNYTGPLEADPGSFRVGTMAATMMMCSDDLMTAETTYRFLLSAANDWSIGDDGTLTLSTDGAESLRYTPAS